MLVALSLSSVKIKKVPKPDPDSALSLGRNIFFIGIQISFLYSNAAGDLQQIKEGICSCRLMVYADDVLQLWETGWGLVAVHVRRLK